eukprot:SAG11_NODE_5944_length_1428_cov_0.988713_2_plen_279_part_01
MEQSNADGIVDESELELLETARQWFEVSGDGEADRESFQMILGVLATAAWTEDIEPVTDRPMWTNKETGVVIFDDPCTPGAVDAWLERVTKPSQLPAVTSQSKWKLVQQGVRSTGAFRVSPSKDQPVDSTGNTMSSESSATTQSGSKWKRAHAVRYTGAFESAVRTSDGVVRTSHSSTSEATRSTAEATSISEAASRPMTIEAMFAEINHSNDGHVTFAELRTWWVEKCVSNGFAKEEAEAIVQRAKPMFEQLDFDGTGQCDFDDIQAIIENMAASHWL